jgi:hypothetical protein
MRGDGHLSLCHTCDIFCDILCDLPEPHGARRDVCAGTLALQAGTACSGNRSKA